MQVAAGRRLWDELHTEAALEFIYRFSYQASYGDAGAEHELCSVFLGRLAGEPAPNETEIAAVQYLSRNELDSALAADPEAFTPWLKMEWQRLNDEFAEQLSRYT